MARLTRELGESVSGVAKALTSATQGVASVVTSVSNSTVNLVDGLGTTSANLVDVANIYSLDLAEDARYESKANEVKRSIKLQAIEKVAGDKATLAKAVETVANSFIKELEEDLSF